MKNQLQAQVQTFFDSMSKMHRLMAGRKQAYTKKFNITHPQVMVLMALSEMSYKTVKEIAQWMEISSSGATQVIEGLEEKALLIRENDKSDRRVVKVSLTAKGKKKVRDIKDLHERFFETLLKELTQQERELLVGLPERIINLLNKANEKHN
jgi:DNA-binding MarR family transcriptional regulator